MRHQPELELDRALESGRPVQDPALADLVDVASRLRRSLAAEPPSSARQRMLFASGAGAHRPRPSRMLVPAVAAVALVAALGWAGRNALPGDTLYPVREVLEEIGLARSAVDEIDEHIASAEAMVEIAEEAVDEQPERAERLARDAIAELGDARRLLNEVGPDAATREERIDSLARRALAVIAAAHPASGGEDETEGGGDGSVPGVGGDEDEGNEGRGGAGEGAEDEGNNDDADDGRGPEDENKDDGDGQDGDQGGEDGDGQGDDDNSGPGNGDTDEDDNKGSGSGRTGGDGGDGDSGSSGSDDGDDADDNNADDDEDLD